MSCDRVRRDATASAVSIRALCCGSEMRRFVSVPLIAPLTCEATEVSSANEPSRSTELSSGSAIVLVNEPSWADEQTFGI